MSPVISILDINTQRFDPDSSRNLPEHCWSLLEHAGVCVHFPSRAAVAFCRAAGGNPVGQPENAAV